MDWFRTFSRCKVTNNLLELNIFMLRDAPVRHTLWILILLAAAMEAAFFGLSRVPTPEAQVAQLPYFFGAAFLAYALAVGYVGMYWNRSFFSPEWILVAAVAFRLTFLWSSPVLSDDIYRYIWDGHVAASGIDPYRYTPDSPNLFGLRDSTLYPLVNHKDVHTIYPPLLQLLFQALAVFTTSPLVYKTVFVMFDVAIIVVLFKFLTSMERPLGWAIVYAWNPLVVLETSWSGHADTVGVFFLLVGLMWAVRARSVWASVFLALSGMAKFFGLVFLPFLEDVRVRWRTIALVLLAASAITIGCYVPFLEGRHHWFTGMNRYVETWEFNSSLYSIVEALYEHRIGPSTAGRVFGFDTDNQARWLARATLIGAVTLTGLWLLIAHYRRSYHDQKTNILRVAFLLTGLALLTSPTLHPWYLLWIIPLLCFFPNVAWILLSGLVVISYEALGGQISGYGWIETPRTQWWIYLPFYAVLFSTFAWKTIVAFRKAHPGEPA